jgi:hypothetical protein
MRQAEDPWRTFKTGKDVLGWDQSQVRTWDGICRHTALAALAQLRAAAIRNALCGGTGLAPAVPAAGDRAAPDDGDDVNDADLQIPLGDAPVPVRGGQPCPPRIAPIGLSVAETARLTRLAAQAAAGLITRVRLAFALRWSARRRRHQATARWHQNNPPSCPFLLPRLHGPGRSAPPGPCAMSGFDGS